MAIVKKTVLGGINLRPIDKWVEITLLRQLVDDQTNEIVGTELGGALSSVYKIGIDDDALREVLGVDKANLLINNL